MVIARSTEIHYLPSISYCRVDLGDVFLLSDNLSFILGPQTQ